MNTLIYLQEHVAYEPILLVKEPDADYILGSELAVHRIAMHVRTFEVGCSSYFRLWHGHSWWVRLPKSKGN